jgi:prolipoprotein diacylglyceryltransferase
MSLNMGQLLSIPLIIAGAIIFVRALMVKNEGGK